MGRRRNKAPWTTMVWDSTIIWVYLWSILMTGGKISRWNHRILCYDMLIQHHAILLREELCAYHLFGDNSQKARVKRDNPKLSYMARLVYYSVCVQLHESHSEAQAHFFYLSWMILFNGSRRLQLKGPKGSFFVKSIHMVVFFTLCQSWYRRSSHPFLELSSYHD